MFVSQLVIKADERGIRKYFEKVGKVKQVIMIRDKYTNRHKGFAYVEMKDLESIPLVLMLNAIAPDFQKFPVLIKASEAEKNFLAKQEADASGGAGDKKKPKEKVKNRLYVGNLHVHITEEDLRSVMQPFGEIEMVSLVRDEVGTSKGFAFVTFKSPEDAATALQKIGGLGLELMGKAIKVAYPQSDVEPTAPGQGPQGQAWKLDEDEGGSAGMQLNSASRAALMTKLGQSAGVAPPPAPIIMQPGMPGGMPGMPGGMPGMPGGMPGMPMPGMGMQGQGLDAAKAMAAGMAPKPAPTPPSGQPTFCFMIRNMFDPASETEPGWDQDIKEDVETECSKFGSVLHCYVEKIIPGGLVYLLFSTVQTAVGAATSLSGRWFAGRMITCEYLHPDRYAAQFPEAAQGVSTARATAANAGF